jgi:NAD-dependent dihydropyrimidine dehydrogenase PreA subunit
MNTAILVCGDSPELAISIPDAVVIEGLCQDPSLLRDCGTQPDRAVVVLHSDSFDLPAVQKALRGINIDPLGVQLLDIGNDDDPSVLSHQVEGLKQRATAFAGSAPEHAKPVFSSAVTRRGFLRPPTPAYIAAPQINHTTCAAGDGCRACVDVCPEDAYRWSAGRISYDKDACVPCGRCVTGCPTGAIVNPAATSAMIDAQVRTVIAASDKTTGIRFVCSRGSVAAQSGWADITVPCTSMVPASWLLACHLLGATCAKAVPCRDAGCPIDGGSLVTEASEIARAVLSQTGFDAAMITGDSLIESIELSGTNLFEARNTAELMLALTVATGVDFVVESKASQLGIVSIDDTTCTLCGQCAKICPTNALRESYEDEVISISFDAKACVNCSQCIAECPEIERGAISVIGLIDTRRLAGGRVTLNEGTVSSCEICGNAIAPETMMNRIGDLLGEEFRDTMKMVEARCLDCRGRG